MEGKDFTKEIYFALLVFLFIALGFICKSLASVILPIIFAMMLAFVFLPIVDIMHKKLKLPWLVATIFISVLLIVTISSIGSLVASGLGIIVNEYSKYENRFLNIYIFFAQKLNLEFDAGKSFIENIWGQLKVREYLQSLAIGFSTGFISFGKNLFMVLLMFIFLILEIKTVKVKIKTAFEGQVQSKVLEMASSIIQEVVHFLSIKFVISLTTGILVFLGCVILKIDFAIVWGFLAFAMNFIPIFGSIISTILITIFAMLQFYPLFSRPLIIFIYVILVNTILGNIVEPRVEGKHLGLSPFVILVSLALWGYLWGFIGLLLAVPMTVIIKIICENIDYLKPIAILLGSSKKE